MTNNVESKSKDWTKSFNKVLYTGLLLVACIHLFLNKDIPDALSSLGIALIFDPFNPAQPWAQRPLYQRAWLLAHLSIVLLGFGYILIR